MKYHAYLNANPGIKTLPINPCQLLDFNLLKLGSGEEYAAHAGDREIFAVLLGGKTTFTINGTTSENAKHAE